MNESAAVQPMKTNISNAEWQDRKNQAMARGEGNLAPIYIDHARNSELWDVEGRRYIDFGTGIAVCSTGHAHPRIVAAVTEQIEKFSHTCIMVTPYSSAVTLAERLNNIVPGPSPKKTMYVTTGAEAIENTIKIARAHTGRKAVIAFNGGYHGRTNLTLGLTGKNVPYKTLFGPFPGDIYRAPFPIPYHGVSVEDSLEALANLFKCDIAPEEVAAIIVEPVQGEGGFYPAPDNFLRALRRICDEHGIVMVADEIQTGFARTGKLFCMEYSGVEPDLIAMAKGMAGGYPISAVVGKAEIMDAPLPGGLGGTYAGSPLGCVAALTVLDIIEDEKLVEASQNIATEFDVRLKLLQEKYPNVIGDIRTDRGAMMAMEFVHDGDASKPNTELVSKVIGHSYQNGLVTLKCGIRDNVLRFLPALTIGESELDEGLDILEKSIRDAV